MTDGSSCLRAAVSLLATLLLTLPLRGQNTPSGKLSMSPVIESGAASTPEPGVSHALAIARAVRVSDLRYQLSFTLQPHAPKTPAHETLTFRDSGQGDLPIDFRDGDLTSAVLNGHELLAQTVNGHLILPAAALHSGENTLETSFAANIASAGKAITRYEDKDDGSEYLYTLFVPMDASMAFPCFDQPDLKARFTLTLTAPSAWSVIGNSTGLEATEAPYASGSSHTWYFPETRPISTYLFAFAAGPFVRIPGAHPGEPALFVRKSQLSRAQSEAPQVQQMTARGIAWLSDYFQQPFPFPKYDLVLIPGFPFGGMEHAGATFLNEDGVLFRTAPTQADYFRRNILVLHETTHQWFGDLVTMRWFDDLWLKEGFAQYMAYKTMAALDPASNPWKRFYEDIKPLAYGIDETQGTTPIFQEIPNLKDAKSAYGAIVYQKAPAVLKQLNFALGDQRFRSALRLYLKQHAYGNAAWADLIAAFDSTDPSPRCEGACPASWMQSWANAWITRRGMPQVETSVFACSGGKVEELTLFQHDVLGTGATWPITAELLLAYPADKTAYLPGQPSEVTDLSGMKSGRYETLRVTWDTPSLEVVEARGKPCPAFVFANASDQAYGRFLLDGASLNVVSPRIDGLDDPLLRSQLYGALWDNVHIAQSPPASYVELALRSLPTEMDESIARIQGTRIATALHAYLGPKSRRALLPRAEAVTAERMLHAPTLGLRIVSFRTFTGIAETPQALGQIKALLDGSLTVPGMPLKPLDRWNLIGHLIAQNDPEAATRFAAEKMKDRTGEGQRYAYAAEAGTPNAQTKQRYFKEYLQNGAAGEARQEDWITQSLRPFNAWNQAALTATYLTRALDALPEIKQHRKIFFLGAWLGAFVDRQNSPEAQAAVHAWLAGKNIDPDLRLKVLEVSDALDRTVLIRQRFPE